MRLRIKTGESSKMFKLRSEKKEDISIIWMQIGKMNAVRDPMNMEPNQDSEEFALGCLDIINKFYRFEGYPKITKQNLIEPTWNKFKDSCNREWHYIKATNKFLRSYYFESKGFLRLKIDNKTPKEVFDKLGLQSRDRIAIKIDKHNDRLKSDTKIIGMQPKGMLPAPNQKE